MPGIDVTVLFQRCDEQVGRRPHPHEEPTGDELQAFKVALHVDMAPCASWVHMGAARRNSSLTVMILAGRSLQEKQQDGLEYFHTWQRFWKRR